jgi:protoporphyrinogen IX oxidase
VSDWVGWLGGAYLWVKALHIVFVVFWMAGMFMLPRYLVYQHPTEPGSAEDLLWAERTARLRRIILTPAMNIVWLLGLALVVHVGLAGNVWLWVKLAVVFVFSGFHGAMVTRSKRMAAGDRSVSERRLRMLNEVPSFVAVVVVLLAVAKPF